MIFSKELINKNYLEQRWINIQPSFKDFCPLWDILRRLFLDYFMR